MTCPECQNADLRYRSADSVETHGLDCGPYEHCHDEWYECPECGTQFDSAEVAARTPSRPVFIEAVTAAHSGRFVAANNEAGEKGSQVAAAPLGSLRRTPRE